MRKVTGKPQIRGYTSLEKKYIGKFKDLYKGNESYFMDRVLSNLDKSVKELEGVELNSLDHQSIIRVGVFLQENSLLPQLSRDERQELVKKYYKFYFQLVSDWDKGNKREIRKLISEISVLSYKIGFDETKRNIINGINKYKNKNIAYQGALQDLSLDDSYTYADIASESDMKYDYSVTTELPSRAVATIVSGLVILRLSSRKYKQKEIESQVKKVFNSKRLGNTTTVDLMMKYITRGQQKATESLPVSKDPEVSLFHEWRINKPKDSPCNNRNGLIVKVGEAFDIGDGRYPTYGGSIHPRCQCITTPIVNSKYKNFLNKYYEENKAN